MGYTTFDSLGRDGLDPRGEFYRDTDGLDFEDEEVVTIKDDEDEEDEDEYYRRSSQPTRSKYQPRKQFHPRPFRRRRP